MNIHDVCDYTILKVSESSAGLNNLKLQKLIYYIQAWHLAFHGNVITPAKFQAWVHGPVCREIYDRFASSKSLYSEIDTTDLRPDFDPNALTEEKKAHIDKVLEAYAKYAGYQLEEMTHSEQPWINAREGYRASQRCEVEIDERIMETYYKSRLNS